MSAREELEAHLDVWNAGPGQRRCVQELLIRALAEARLQGRQEREAEFIEVLKAAETTAREGGYYVGLADGKHIGYVRGYEAAKSEACCFEHERTGFALRYDQYCTQCRKEWP